MDDKTPTLTVLDGSEERRRTIKTLKILTALFVNAYTLVLISGNMRYDTNILDIHPNGMATFKKTVIECLKSLVVLVCLSDACCIDTLI